MGQTPRTRIPMSDFQQLSRSVAGLTAFITGAASGMGRATAHVFAAEGANVAVTDFSMEGAAAVAAEIAAQGGKARAWALDVSHRDTINGVIKECATHFGGLDIVINNAGISVSRPIDSDDYEAAWDKAITVMLTAHPRVVRAALPYLRKSKSPRIVNIASTEALGATATFSPYSAAKGRGCRLDSLAGGRTGARGHYRQLHLPRADHNRHDGTDSGRAKADLCEAAHRARALRRPGRSGPYDLEPLPAGGFLPDGSHHSGRWWPNGAERLTPSQPTSERIPRWHSIRRLRNNWADSSRSSVSRLRR